MNREPITDIALGKKDNPDMSDYVFPSLEQFNRRAAMVFALSILFTGGTIYVAGCRETQEKKEMDEYLKHRKLDEINLKTTSPNPDVEPSPPSAEPAS